MSFRRLIAAAAVAALALAAAASGAHELIRPAMRTDAAQPTSASVYNLESKWTTQNDANVALASLGGKPVVAAMGYTTCTNICPAVLFDMMWIEKHLPPGTGNAVQFAFFSFDPGADTPERLTLYAQGHGLDLARWTLFSADNDAARELAAALDVSYRPNSQDGFDHAAVISLLDKNGEIVFQQRGAEASSEEFLARLTALLSKGD